VTLRWIPFCMAGLALPALLLGGCAAKPATAGEGDPERGRYLVTSLGCGDCHSPKLMGPQGPSEDKAQLLAGHPEGKPLPPPPSLSGPWITAATWDQTAWTGPWGISYATNLTPDENTGIGIWTDDMFVNALQKGKHMGAGRPILPPMPWFWYNKLPDDDLKAIYAYLKSIPAIANKVPPPTGPDGKPLS
jgi:hypothetical protein